MKNQLFAYFNLPNRRSLQLALMISCLLLICTTAIGQEFQIEANYVSTPPVIDGIPEEAAWQITKLSILKENRSGMDVQDLELSTKVLTCYDNENLYIAFICKDPDIWTTYTKRDQHLWKEEAVEVFIDMDDIPENYVEIEVSPANVLFDSYIVNPEKIDVTATSSFNLAGIRTAVQVNGTLNKRGDLDHSWTVEIAIPFKDLKSESTKEIGKGTELKINFYRLDHNKEQDRGAYAWSPTGGSFHKPSVFGTLKLK